MDTGRKLWFAGLLFVSSAVLGLTSCSGGADADCAFPRGKRRNLPGDAKRRRVICDRGRQRPERSLGLGTGQR